MTEQRAPYRPADAELDRCVARHLANGGAGADRRTVAAMAARIRQLEAELLCARAELARRPEIAVDRLSSSATTYDSVVFVAGEDASCPACEHDAHGVEGCQTESGEPGWFCGCPLTSKS